MNIVRVVVCRAAGGEGLPRRPGGRDMQHDGGASTVGGAGRAGEEGRHHRLHTGHQHGTHSGLQGGTGRSCGGAQAVGAYGWGMQST